jgi:glutamate formiminotransferase/formiminotetrahydrofolate cyclodeaminase
MVARVTIGKKKYASVEDLMRKIEQQAESLRSDLTVAVEADAEAFEDVLAAYRLPKDTPEDETHRANAIETATLHAAEIPLSVAQKAVEILRLSGEAVEHGNLNAISDAGSAVALAGASLTGAALNVRINATALMDTQLSDRLVTQIKEIEGIGNGLLQDLRGRIAERGGLSQI